MAKNSVAHLEHTSLPAHHEMLKRYIEARTQTLKLGEPLSPEDQMVQSMPDASPTKWHLAHTTWFFETFILTPHVRDYAPFDEPQARWQFSGIRMADDCI